MNGWDSTEIGGYEIRVHDYTQMNVVSKRLYEILPQG